MYEQISKRMLARSKKIEKALKEVKCECDGFSIKTHNINFTLPCETNGWQPIESAPKDGTEIDLWANKRQTNCLFTQGKWYNSRSYQVCNPTHWMHLPEPPKEET